MYLRDRDFTRFIQTDNLNQILSADSTLRLLAEGAAQEEVLSYLSAKYNTTAEFTDTGLWDKATVYGAQSRVELNFPAYVPENTYNIGDCVSVGAIQYVVKVDATTGAFDVANFSVMGSVYDLWYIPYPKPLFSIYGTYAVGDQVWYKGKTYTAVIQTAGMSHESYLNAGTVNNLPLQNIFPDDPKNGAAAWGVGVAYTVTAIAPNAVVSPWVKGDNRSQQLVTILCDVTLYHLHSRIAPQNVPVLRENRYNAAISWLKKANSGDIIPQIMKLIQPTQGTRIRFGGNVKNVNQY